MKGKIFLTALLCAVSARAQDISGKVAETMNAGGYTYARVVKGDASTWVAVPQMKLKTGDSVNFQGGMVMNKFDSKTLHRTFDKIIFSGGPASGAAASPGAAPAASAPTAAASNAHGGTPKGKKDAAIRIEKAPGGLSVAEVYAQRAELSGKSVTVRGRVTKVNHAIMNRNWIHLQDGTGDSKKGDFDLLVTTDQDAKVGETVTAKGTAAKDQDFGMGYKYSVLLEKTEFSR